MNESKPRKRLGRHLKSFLLIDLLMDDEARPVFIYVLSTILLGGIAYRWLEGWDWLDAFYFVVITTTTIGYGDLTPTTSLSKFVTIFFALNGVAILVMLIDQIRRVRGRRIQKIAEEPILNRSGNDGQ